MRVNRHRILNQVVCKHPNPLDPDCNPHQDVDIEVDYMYNILGYGHANPD